MGSNQTSGEVARRSMERSLLNITKRDKIRNEITRSKTGLKDIIERARCMRGQWAGHAAIMNHTRWAKITTEWTLREGQRVRGTLQRKWRDNIEEIGNSPRMKVAQNRSTWREVWRPSARICQHWHERLRDDDEYDCILLYCDSSRMTLKLCIRAQLHTG